MLWRNYFIKLIKLGVSSNCEIVTTSKYSKNGLKNIFNNKISYIYQSSERIFYSNEINKSKDYILHIGTFERRKDLYNSCSKHLNYLRITPNQTLNWYLQDLKILMGINRFIKRLKIYLKK